MIYNIGDSVYTGKYGLKLLYQHQAQKDITVNENFIKLDKIIGGAIISKTLRSPPKDIIFEGLYIVGENPINEWQDRKNEIALYQGSWNYIKPFPGMMFWALEPKSLIVYDNNEWIEIINYGSKKSSLWY